MYHPNLVLTLVEVTAATVRRGDLLEIGQREFKVDHAQNMPGGGKRVYFDTGEAFLMCTGTRLFAMRPVQPAGRV
ncbi:hypothetical protein [Streptomyces luteireticuli]|uniref:hypothetical protein n=1 Tax=Streptomyces luteireticuli TaxID=173858 RepID=UPI003555C29A